MNKPVLILHGTVTGNAEICANKTAERLNATGRAAIVRNIFDMPPSEIENEETLLICISTYGEGDPPDTAVPMWEALVRNGNFNLHGLQFAVLALGDSSYKHFCQCGKDFDAALERQGARRLAPRMDADVEYESSCAAWTESVTDALKNEPVPESIACNAH